MKNVILYYSYTGNTKKLAEELAGKSGADLIEVKDRKRPGKLRAFLVGIPTAIKMKGWAIQPPPPLDGYDGFIVLGSVWASRPAPAVTSLLKAIPAGKSVGVVLVSQSGNSEGSEEKIRALLEQQGCTLRDFKNAKA